MTLTPGRRVLLEWLLITSLLVVLAATGTRHALRIDQPWSSLHRADALIRDTLQPLAAVAPDPGLLLVEIDQASLDAFGRWPWRRNIHATMIETLVAAKVRAIGLDVLFVETSADDPLLAHAITQARQAGVRMILPISIAQSASGSWYPLYPVDEIGLAAELGHVHFRIDGDGLVRGLYLQEGGFPAFSALLVPPAAVPGLQTIAQQALEQATPVARDQSFAKAQWSLRQLVLLPRLNAPLPRVSYVDVLRSPQAVGLAGRTVVIGATAAGIGDQYASSMIGPDALSAGVELHTAAASAISQRRLLQPFASLASGLLASALVLVMMIALYRSSARLGLILSFGLAATAIGLAAVLLRAGYWWPPSATVLLIALAYPLWSWRRLEAATSGLVRQAQELDTDVLLRAGNERQTLPTEEVSRSVLMLQYAAQRSVELRRLLQSTLQNLPHPAVLIDQNDQRVLHNDRFTAAFGADAESPLQAGTAITPWLAENTGLILPAPAEVSRGHEQRDKRGRDWLIDAVPLRYPDGRSWTLLQMVDLSPIRAAQREREQTLRFLSHDLRSPLLSILTIMREQRDAQFWPWQNRVETFAQRSLELADGFVQLARAENTPIQHVPVDLSDLMIEAADLCWATARENGIRLDSQNLPQDALVEGDAQLIRRALVNLIDNAVKFSPRDERVTLTLCREPASASPLRCDCWCAAVIDRGKGLSAEELPRVFDPFWRSGQHENRPGAGLGLTFVRVVAERHGGLVNAAAGDQGGTRFELRFPAV